MTSFFFLSCPLSHHPWTLIKSPSIMSSSYLLSHPAIGTFLSSCSLMPKLSQWILWYLWIPIMLHCSGWQFSRIKVWPIAQVSDALVNTLGLCILPGISTSWSSCTIFPFIFLPSQHPCFSWTPPCLYVWVTHPGTQTLPKISFRCLPLSSYTTPNFHHVAL